MSICTDEAIHIVEFDGEFPIYDPQAPEGGLIALSTGQTSVDIIFANAKKDANYVIEEDDVEYVGSGEPLLVKAIRVARTPTGMTYQFAPVPDSDDYRFRWKVRFYNAIPTAENAASDPFVKGALPTVLLADLPKVKTVGLPNNGAVVTVVDPVNESSSQWVFQTAAAQGGDVTPNDNSAARWRKMQGL